MNNLDIASPVNSVYVAIIFDTKDEGTWLSMDTSKKVPDYFISMTVKKPLQEAMQVTIQLSYAPFAAGQEAKDPNLIENLLIKYSGECFLRWGWGDAAGKVTPLCKCLITSYECTLESGYLNYTLKGVSKSVIYNYDTMTISSSGKTHFDFLKEVYTKGKVDNNYVFDESCKDLLDEKSGVKSSQSGSMTGTPIKIMAEYVGSLSKKTTKKSNDDGYFVMVVDDSTVGNDDGRGTIHIRYVDSKTMIGSGPNGEVITFNWNSLGTKENSVDEVLSWSPKYDGAVMIFAGRDQFVQDATAAKEGKDDKKDSSKKTKDSKDEESTNDSRVTNLEVDMENGKPVYCTDPKVSVSPGADFFTTSGIRGACKADIDSQWWGKHLGSYSYPATLTVLGRVDSVASGQQVFYIQPLIGNQEHNSAGYYLVKDITDSISANGFTTTYELVKLGYTIRDGKIAYFNDGVGFYKERKGDEKTGFVLYNGFFENTSDYVKTILGEKTSTEVPKDADKDEYVNVTFVYIKDYTNNQVVSYRKNTEISIKGKEKTGTEICSGIECTELSADEKKKFLTYDPEEDTYTFKVPDKDKGVKLTAQYYDYEKSGTHKLTLVNCICEEAEDPDNMIPFEKVLTIKPDSEHSGKKFAKLTSSVASVTLKKKSDTEYVFRMPTSDVTITAEY